MLDTILPFLKPIADLITDSDISEIMVNGNGSVFYQRNSAIHELEDAVIDQRQLEQAAKRIARLLSKDVSERSRC